MRNAIKVSGVGRRRKVKCALLAGAVVVSLTGCAGGVGETHFSGAGGGDSKLSLSSVIPEGMIDTEVRQLAAKGIEKLDDGDYDGATEAFNVALKLDITNSYLHFLNAYAYHLKAANGGVNNYSLAEEGYRQALTFDETNWIADYYLGLAYFDQRKFRQAQVQFAKVAQHRDDDADVLYDLASASYYAHDPRTADAALTRLRELVPADWRGGRVLRVSAIVKASLKDEDGAEGYAESYREISDERDADGLERRLRNWKRAYNSAELERASAVGRGVSPGTELAQMDTMNAPPDTMNSGMNDMNSGMNDLNSGMNAGADAMNAGQSPQQNGDFVEDQMAVVDVVIIRTEEDLSTSKGVNLLSGLQLQFGDPTTPIPGFSFSSTKTTDAADSTNNVDSRTLTRLISIPSVTYSLNIANSLSARNEILARPSLVALSNQTSEFFSGVEVAAAATSGGNGDSVSIEKEIGVRLAITPEFLPGNRVKLQVIAERTFLTTPSSSVVFEFRLDTSKTTVNANVAMKFGETLILSGLSEKESENNRDGVPFLQDVPLVQYLFSKAGTRDFRKSVLILLTPRRAQYVNRSAEDRQRDHDKLSEFEKTIADLEMNHKDWFPPPSPFTAINEHMQTNSLYQEFRTGDVPKERWNGRLTHGERLKSAIDFLFF